MIRENPIKDKIRRNYCIAEHAFTIGSFFSYTHNQCNEYVTDKEPEFVIESTQEEYDVEYSKRGIAPEKAEEEFIYAKIVKEYAKRDVVDIHGSCIEHEGIGYLFIANSGTGKSTHTNYWHEELGARWINDDKPFVHIEENGNAIAYGTPWCGKHNRGENIAVPLKNIIILERGEENEIIEISRTDALPRLYIQTHRVHGTEGKILELVSKINARFYRLKCTNSSEAALIAYAGMKNEI